VGRISRRAAVDRSAICLGSVACRVTRAYRRARAGQVVS
jgi:hypothetical protein